MYRRLSRRSHEKILLSCTVQCFDQATFSQNYANVSERVLPHRGGWALSSESVNENRGHAKWRNFRDTFLFYGLISWFQVSILFSVSLFGQITALIEVPINDRDLRIEADADIETAPDSPDIFLITSMKLSRDRKESGKLRSAQFSN